MLDEISVLVINNSELTVIMVIKSIESLNIVALS